MGLYMVSKQTDIILGLVLSADKIHRFLGQESLYAACKRLSSIQFYIENLVEKPCVARYFWACAILIRYSEMFGQDKF
jgi:hypothetical protein